MRLFDLHCDTITECYKRGEHLKENTLQVDLKKGEAFSAWRQTFAVFIPDTMRGQAAVDYFNAVREYFFHELQENPRLGFYDGSETQHTPFSALLSVEGGAVLAGNPQRVEELYRQGVRMMTLTWNGANELADGVMEPTGYGLTETGKAAVLEMNRLGMVVDVSHLSDAGFWDVCRLSETPFVASHSNARTVCPHPRNLTDDEILELIRRRGLIGLNLYNAFLGEDAREHGCEAAFRHIEHMLELGGEDTLAMGCDFDGADTPADLVHVGCLAKLYGFLHEKGYSETLIDKIFYKNAREYFRRVFNPRKL